MNTLLLFLVLSQPGIQLPHSTTEQQILIEKLGDFDFFIREQTEKQLEKMDLKVYHALLSAINKNYDPEIRFRARSILNRIMSVPMNYVPGIQGAYNLNIKLSSGIKFYGDATLIRKYWEESMSNEGDDQRPTPDNPLMHLPTLKLFHDLRLSGYSKEDIQEIAQEMTKNIKNHEINGWELLNWYY